MQSKMKTAMNIAVFLVALFLITSLRGQATVSVNIDKGSMTFTGPDGYHRVIDYDEIQIDSVTLISAEELDNPGQAIAGGETRKDRWGQWENEAQGEYTACLIRKIDAAILFETTGGETVIFNMENDDTTATLSGSFPELVAYYQDGKTA